MPFLTAQSHRLEYRLIPAMRAGAAPVVLLHEGLGSVSLWRGFPDRLAAATGSAVLVYSRWGHGRSDPLTLPRPVDYMHREALVALPEILDRLDIQCPVLAGHSDGASIALIHAGGGHRVRGLALMAPHVFVEDRSVAGIAAAVDAYAAAGLRDRLARHHDHVDEMFRGWSEAWLSPAFRDWDIREYLPAIDCPLLLVQGDDDEYGTLAQLEAIRDSPANTAIERLILPRCGHAPHRDRPEEVLAVIAAFVERLAGS